MWKAHLFSSKWCPSTPQIHIVFFELSLGHLSKCDDWIYPVVRGVNAFQWPSTTVAGHWYWCLFSSCIEKGINMASIRLNGHCWPYIDQFEVLWDNKFVLLLKGMFFGKIYAYAFLGIVKSIWGHWKGIDKTTSLKPLWLAYLKLFQSGINEL